MERRAPFASTALSVILFTFVVVGESSSINGAEHKPAWQVKWEKIVEAAKREGQLIIYGGAEPLLILEEGVFQQKFPEIKVITVSSLPINSRLLTERRAGKYLADVMITGSTGLLELYTGSVLDPMKAAFILPEVLDESKWWGGKHRYVDPESQYIFMYNGTPQLGGITYNTRLVNPKEINSFWDFLNPKWKGKILSRDITTPGPGSANTRFFYYNPMLGPPFIKRLYGEMDITLFRDRRQPVDWLATGKFAFCFFCYPVDIGMALAQGLPIARLSMMKEGASITSSAGTVSIVNRAPHPNAARVFINWLLSRDGQITFQKVSSRGMAGASNSLRTDIPKDMVPPDERLVEGINYIETEIPERMSMEPIIKVFKEALAEAEKRKAR